MMRVIIKNKTDLIFLILTKILFAYSIYLFSTNFLQINFFAYPDMTAYKVCFGEGLIMVNLLYTQFLCSLNLNYEEAISSHSLILIASLINTFSICAFFLLFKDFLNRKGQIIFILLLALHPYLAIYFPRFFTDIFGSLGILLICYYSIKKIKIDTTFMFLSLILINFRAALIVPIVIYTIYEILKELKAEKTIHLGGILFIVLLGMNYLLYKVFADTFIINSNFYDNKILNIIFLLGFREGVANEGFMQVFFTTGLNGSLQFVISLILLAIHSLGFYAFIRFINVKKLHGIACSMTILIVPLLAIAHMRYLLPVIPLLLFSLSWNFFKKEG
ncbi:MAG: hypothetical protein CMI71_00130 [Candidatus Pelagibacter sp.]|nr:hypothetical protein [Candidatus Pelagibacter sp.]|tara:strand:- start:8818 stop:9813 length:996 start_codon:yes stop_codon:yes gene_type:complete